MNYNPFDILAGCSLGTVSQKGLLLQLIALIEKHNDGSQNIEAWKRDAESINETDTQDSIEEATAYLQTVLELPTSCTIEWQDNELTVLPYIDDWFNQVTDVPEDNIGEVIYSINCHGNVTCYEWVEGEYKEVWSKV